MLEPGHRFSQGAHQEVDTRSDKQNACADDGDEGSSSGLFDVFQPKKTTLAARMGFASDLMDRYDSGVTLSKSAREQALFVDFVRQLLIVDPDERPSAKKALEHPWMLYAAELTEEDIKYPEDED